MSAAPGLARWRVRAGYPLALLCLWLATPTVKSLWAGALVSLLGLTLRAAAAGYLRKHEELATGGPYAYTRNPLYLGSAILAAAFVIASWSWWVAALVVAYFVAFYPRVMRGEEAELRARYGAAFDEYTRRVPLFWPRRKAWRGSSAASGRFSWAVYSRNREYQAAIGFAAVIVLLWLRMRWP